MRTWTTRRNMRSTLGLACLIFYSLLTVQCSNTESSQFPKRQTLDSLKTSTPPLVVSEYFMSFIQEFSLVKTPRNYDREWFSQYLADTHIREISAKYCEQYLFGKKIQMPTDTYTVPNDISCYYVERLPDSGNYVALIYSDLSEEMPTVYLCTYNRSGRFLQGLPIYQESQSEPTIETVLSIENHQLVLKQNYGSTTAKILTINPNGRLPQS